MSAALYRKSRNFGCRITDDLVYKGYRSLLLENEQILIHLLLDKGSEPIRWLHKPSDTDLIWQTRMGLLPEHALYPDYQMSYLGGWQELFPEVSKSHEYREATLHRGEAAITPWDYSIVRDDPDEIRVVLTNRIRSLPFRIEKEYRLRSGDATVRIEETIINESPTAVLEANWGHHLAYGAPFLTKHSRVELGAGETIYRAHLEPCGVWPEAIQEGKRVDLSVMADPGTKRELLCVIPQEGKYKLVRQEDGLSAEVRWDHRVWPYLWYWQNFQGNVNAPFYGCEYNIGLEMFNVPPSWTVAEAASQGKALKVEPLGSLTSWLEIEISGGNLNGK